jgi:DNA-directed RNA polymerase subunit alpha
MHLEEFCIRRLCITSVRIGVDHEFSTISGVVEDVTEIILNLKQVRFKRQIEDIDNEAVTISVSGKDQLTAGDFQNFISGFQVLNPELVICNLDQIKLNFDLTIEKVEDMFLLKRTKNRMLQLDHFTDSIFTR